MREARAFVGPLLLLVMCSVQAANFAVVSFGDGASMLYLVRKIFIEETPPQKEKRLDLYLKRELERSGFTIVDTAAEADAILSVTGWGEMVLDGDSSTPPPKSIYQFQLVLPNKKSIWKMKLKLVSKPIAEEYEYAARKISEKLASDWKKSAKKAGIK